MSLSDFHLGNTNFLVIDSVSVFIYRWNRNERYSARKLRNKYHVFSFMACNFCRKRLLVSLIVFKLLSFKVTWE